MTDAITLRPPLSMGLSEWTMLLVLSVLWGGSFLFVAIAVPELPTFTIVALRVGLAALALWAYALATGRPVPRYARVWTAFLGMGFLNNVVPFSLIVWAQGTVEAGLASILNATTPLFTVLVAGVALGDERITGRKVAGVVVGFSGVVLMMGVEVLSGLASNALAQAAILGAALSYACATVFGRRFARWGVDPVLTAAGQVTASAAMLVPAALLVDRPWTLPMPSGAAVVAIVALALLSTALAYILYFRILQRAGATSLALVTFLIPVSAILMGAVVLHERLDWAHGAGMALIALGLVAISKRRPPRSSGF